MLSEFLHSVSSVTVILLLTATGYFCAARGWLTPAVRTGINRIIMNLAIPCMCIYGLTTQLSRAMLIEYGRYLLVPIGCISLNYLLSFALGRAMRLPRKTLGVFVLMCSMSNTMFVGYAMCHELFGDVSVPYIMLFYLVSTAFTQVVGLSVIRWAGGAETHSVKKMLRFLTSPAIVAVFIGLALVLLDVRLPSLIESYMGYMNRIVSPLAMLCIGAILHEIGLRELKIDKKCGVMLAFRFLFAPGMVLLACVLMGIEGLARSVFVVEAAMPVLAIASVAAAEYGADERFAAQGTAISTLCCFVVIPVLMLLL